MTTRNSYSHNPRNPVPPGGFSGPDGDESMVVMQTQRNTLRGEPCDPGTISEYGGEEVEDMGD